MPGVDKRRRWQGIGRAVVIPSSMEGRPKWRTGCSLDNGRPSSLAWSLVQRVLSLVLSEPLSSPGFIRISRVRANNEHRLSSNIGQRFSPSRMMKDRRILGQGKGGGMFYSNLRSSSLLPKVFRQLLILISF